MRKKNQFSGKEIQYCFEIPTSVSIYILDYPDLTVSNFMENYIG